MSIFSRVFGSDSKAKQQRQREAQARQEAREQAELRGFLTCTDFGKQVSASWSAVVNSGMMNPRSAAPMLQSRGSGGDSTAKVDDANSVAVPDLVLLPVHHQRVALAFEGDLLNHTPRHPSVIIPAAIQRFIVARCLVDSTWERAGGSVDTIADASPQRTTQLALSGRCLLLAAASNEANAGMLCQLGLVRAVRQLLAYAIDALVHVTDGSGGGSGGDVAPRSRQASHQFDEAPLSRSPSGATALSGAGSGNRSPEMGTAAAPSAPSVPREQQVQHEASVAALVETALHCLVVVQMMKGRGTAATPAATPSSAAAAAAAMRASRATASGSGDFAAAEQTSSSSSAAAGPPFLSAKIALFDRDPLIAAALLRLLSQITTVLCVPSASPGSGATGGATPRERDSGGGLIPTTSSAEGLFSVIAGLAFNGGGGGNSSSSSAAASSSTAPNRSVFMSLAQAAVDNGQSPPVPRGGSGHLAQRMLPALTPSLATLYELLLWCSAADPELIAGSEYVMDNCVRLFAVGVPLPNQHVGGSVVMAQGVEIPALAVVSATLRFTTTLLVTHPTMCIPRLNGRRFAEKLLETIVWIAARFAARPASPEEESMYLSCTNILLEYAALKCVPPVEAGVGATARAATPAEASADANERSPSAGEGRPSLVLPVPQLRLCTSTCAEVGVFFDALRYFFECVLVVRSKLIALCPNLGTPSPATSSTAGGLSLGSRLPSSSGAAAPLSFSADSETERTVTPTSGSPPNSASSRSGNRANNASSNSAAGPRTAGRSSRAASGAAALDCSPSAQLHFLQKAVRLLVDPFFITENNVRRKKLGDRNVCELSVFQFFFMEQLLLLLPRQSAPAAFGERTPSPPPGSPGSSAVGGGRSQTVTTGMGGSVLAGSSGMVLMPRTPPPAMGDRRQQPSFRADQPPHAQGSTHPHDVEAAKRQILDEVLSLNAYSIFLHNKLFPLFQRSNALHYSVLYLARAVAVEVHTEGCHDDVAQLLQVLVSSELERGGRPDEHNKLRPACCAVLLVALEQNRDAVVDALVQCSAVGTLTGCIHQVMHTGGASRSPPTGPNPGDSPEMSSAAPARSQSSAPEEAIASLPSVPMPSAGEFESPASAPSLASTASPAPTAVATGSSEMVAVVTGGGAGSGSSFSPASVSPPIPCPVVIPGFSIVARWLVGTLAALVAIPRVRWHTLVACPKLLLELLTMYPALRGYMSGVIVGILSNFVASSIRDYNDQIALFLSSMMETLGKIMPSEEPCDEQLLFVITAAIRNGLTVRTTLAVEDGFGAFTTPQPLEEAISLNPTHGVVGTGRRRQRLQDALRTTVSDCLKQLVSKMSLRWITVSPLAVAIDIISTLEAIITGNPANRKWLAETVGAHSLVESILVATDRDPPSDLINALLDLVLERTAARELRMLEQADVLRAERKEQQMRREKLAQQQQSSWQHRRRGVPAPLPNGHGSRSGSPTAPGAVAGAAGGGERGSSPLRIPSQLPDVGVMQNEFLLPRLLSVFATLIAARREEGVASNAEASPTRSVRREEPSSPLAFVTTATATNTPPKDDDGAADDGQRDEDEETAAAAAAAAECAAEDVTTPVRDGESQEARDARIAEEARQEVSRQRQLANLSVVLHALTQACAASRQSLWMACNSAAFDSLVELLEVAPIGSTDLIVDLLQQLAAHHIDVRQLKRLMLSLTRCRDVQHRAVLTAHVITVLSAAVRTSKLKMHDPRHYLLFRLRSGVSGLRVSLNDEFGGDGFSICAWIRRENVASFPVHSSAAQKHTEQYRRRDSHDNLYHHHHHQPGVRGAVEERTIFAIHPANVASSFSVFELVLRNEALVARTAIFHNSAAAAVSSLEDLGREVFEEPLGVFLRTQRWQHVVVTHRPGALLSKAQFSVFIDGKEVFSTNRLPFPAIGARASLFIGAPRSALRGSSESNSCFCGQMNAIHAFRVALAPTQVKQLFDFGGSFSNVKLLGNSGTGVVGGVGLGVHGDTAGSSVAAAVSGGSASGVAGAGVILAGGSAAGVNAAAAVTSTGGGGGLSSHNNADLTVLSESVVVTIDPRLYDGRALHNMVDVVRGRQRENEVSLFPATVVCSTFTLLDAISCLGALQSVFTPLLALLCNSTFPFRVRDLTAAPRLPPQQMSGAIVDILRLFESLLVLDVARGEIEERGTFAMLRVVLERLAQFVTPAIVRLIFNVCGALERYPNLFRIAFSSLVLADSLWERCSVEVQLALLTTAASACTESSVLRSFMREHGLVTFVVLDALRRYSSNPDRESSDAKLRAELARMLLATVDETVTLVDARALCQLLYFCVSATTTTAAPTPHRSSTPSPVGDEMNERPPSEVDVAFLLQTDSESAQDSLAPIIVDYLQLILRLLTKRPLLIVLLGKMEAIGPITQLLAHTVATVRHLALRVLGLLLQRSNRTRTLLCPKSFMRGDPDGGGGERATAGTSALPTPGSPPSGLSVASAAAASAVPGAELQNVSLAFVYEKMRDFPFDDETYVALCDAMVGISWPPSMTGFVHTNGSRGESTSSESLARLKRNPSLPARVGAKLVVPNLVVPLLQLAREAPFALRHRVFSDLWAVLASDSNAWRAVATLEGWQVCICDLLADCDPNDAVVDEGMGLLVFILLRCLVFHREGAEVVAHAVACLHSSGDVSSPLLVAKLLLALVTAYGDNSLSPAGVASAPRHRRTGQPTPPSILHEFANAVRLLHIVEDEVFYSKTVRQSTNVSHGPAARRSLVVVAPTLSPQAHQQQHPSNRSPSVSEAIPVSVNESIAPGAVGSSGAGASSHSGHSADDWTDTLGGHAPLSRPPSRQISQEPHRQIGGQPTMRSRHDSGTGGSREAGGGDTDSTLSDAWDLGSIDAGYTEVNELIFAPSPIAGVGPPSPGRSASISPPNAGPPSPPSSQPRSFPNSPLVPGNVPVAAPSATQHHQQQHPPAILPPSQVPVSASPSVSPGQTASAPRWLHADLVLAALKLVSTSPIFTNPPQEVDIFTSGATVVNLQTGTTSQPEKTRFLFNLGSAFQDGSAASSATMTANSAAVGAFPFSGPSTSGFSAAGPDAGSAGGTSSASVAGAVDGAPLFRVDGLPRLWLRFFRTSLRFGGKDRLADALACVDLFHQALSKNKPSESVASTFGHFFRKKENPSTNPRFLCALKTFGILSTLLSDRLAGLNVSTVHGDLVPQPQTPMQGLHAAWSTAQQFLAVPQPQVFGSSSVSAASAALGSRERGVASVPAAVQHATALVNHTIFKKMKIVFFIHKSAFQQLSVFKPASGKNGRAGGGTDKDPLPAGAATALGSGSFVVGPTLQALLDDEEDVRVFREISRREDYGALLRLATASMQRQTEWERWLTNEVVAVHEAGARGLARLQTENNYRRSALMASLEEVSMDFQDRQLDTATVAAVGRVLNNGGLGRAPPTLSNTLRHSSFHFSGSFAGSSNRMFERVWRKFTLRCKGTIWAVGGAKPPRFWKLTRQEQQPLYRCKLRPNPSGSDYSDIARKKNRKGAASPAPDGGNASSALTTAPSVRRFVSEGERREAEETEAEEADRIAAERQAELDEAAERGVGGGAGGAAGAGGVLIDDAVCEVVLDMHTWSATLLLADGVLSVAIDDNNVAYNQPVAKDAYRFLEKPSDMSWHLSEIAEVLPGRRFRMLRTALELRFRDLTVVLLNFPTIEARKAVKRILAKATQKYDVHVGSSLIVEEFRRQGWTDRWRRNEITTFEYLLAMNYSACRTLNDITQYPVFPWVVADYKSDELDLNNVASFRDLSKPIGLCGGKHEDVRRRYEETKEMDQEPLHFFTHYSSAAVVVHFLIRVEPFTSQQIVLQGGSFDHADRMFHSNAVSWNGVLTNMQDVKELIPEFYYLPEMFINRGKIDFGSCQDGKVMSDATLPPWAKGNPYFFVYKLREALESDIVSNNLHLWIDLVFGYKQRGNEAVNALNLYHPYTYEDEKWNKNANIRKELINTLDIVGQTPIQLFTRKHEQRRPVRTVHPITANAVGFRRVNTRWAFPRIVCAKISHERLVLIGSNGVSMVFRLNATPVMQRGTSASDHNTSTLSAFTLSAAEKDCPMSPMLANTTAHVPQTPAEMFTGLRNYAFSFSVPDDHVARGPPIPRGLIPWRETASAATPAAVVAPSSSSLLVSSVVTPAGPGTECASAVHHSGASTLSALSSPASAANAALATAEAAVAAESGSCSNRNVAIIVLNASTIYGVYGGFYDGSCVIRNLISGRDELRLTAHAALVTCVAVSDDGAHLVTGSLDTSFIVWKVFRPTRGDAKLDVLLRFAVSGHEDEPSSAAVSPVVDLVVTAGRNGTVLLHGLATGELEQQLSHPHGHSVDAVLILAKAFLPSVLFASRIDNVIHQYTVNGHPLHVFELCGRLQHWSATADPRFFAVATAPLGPCAHSGSESAAPLAYHSCWDLSLVLRPSFALPDHEEGTSEAMAVLGSTPAASAVASVACRVASCLATSESSIQISVAGMSDGSLLLIGARQTSN